MSGREVVRAKANRVSDREARWDFEESVVLGVDDEIESPPWPCGDGDIVELEIIRKQEMSA